MVKVEGLDEVEAIAAAGIPVFAQISATTRSPRHVSSRRRARR